MGCDIHLAVEQKNEYGQWVRMFPNKCMVAWYEEDWNPIPLSEMYERLGPRGAAEDNRWGADDTWPRKAARDTWYNTRNYTLFGILAGVRDRGAKAIAGPRGWPEDLGVEVRSLLEDQRDEHDMRMGDHTHSWLMVQELLDFPWTRFYQGQTYAKLANEFYSKTLPALEELGKPDQTRIVFGFDN